MKPSTRVPVLGLAVFAIAGAGCSSSPSTTYDAATYDPYIYYSTYPAEMYYSSYYWSDPFYLYYLDSGSTLGVSAEGGGPSTASDDTSATSTTNPTPPIQGPRSLGELLRALARGEEICPGQVTVTPHMITNPCPVNGSDNIRGGVSLSFAGCQLPNGGVLAGAIEVDTMRTTDDECSADTTITIMHTVTITDLSYQGPNGRRLVILNQTATGTTSYFIGQRPSSAAATIDGRLQLYGTDGALVADRMYTGDLTVSPSPDQATLFVDGTLNLDDADGTGSTSMTMANLMRTGDCCFPAGGTISATRSGQRSFGLHVWTFGSESDPACGDATFDGRAIKLGSCL
jgi:hypothetical protein